jgi:hypothetical protein
LCAYLLITRIDIIFKMIFYTNIINNLYCGYYMKNSNQNLNSVNNNVLSITPLALNEIQMIEGGKKEPFFDDQGKASTLLPQKVAGGNAITFAGVFLAIIVVTWIIKTKDLQDHSKKYDEIDLIV